MSNQSGASAEALPLPKGGGATRGLGDSFTPDFNRGTGSYSIDIKLPKGHRNLPFKLGLTYNSGAGDSPFGYGWNVQIPRIQINTDKGVANYIDPEYILGGETLVEVNHGIFRPQVENGFQRIRQIDNGWEITDKDGTITLLGSSSNSRISGDIAGTKRVYTWLADKIRDTSGNEMQFIYLRNGNNLYLSKIRYAVFEIVFKYEKRHDVTSNRRPGFLVKQSKRCSLIEVRRPTGNHPLIRRYKFHYLNDTESPSLLKSVSMEGFKLQSDGSIISTKAPPVDMTYIPFKPEERHFHKVAEDLLVPPEELGKAGLETVDLMGNGLADVVQLNVCRPIFWQNLGQGIFSNPKLLKNFPTPLSSGKRTIMFDVDGCGSSDLIQFEPDHGRYFPNQGNGNFGRPHFLGGKRPISVNLDDSNTDFADINGDGRVDIIHTSSRAIFTWINRGGEDGFDLPTVTIRNRNRNLSPDVMLSEPGVFISDMTGDGMPDIVHISSGLIEYWPSLGNGCYDKRITFENSPLLPRNYDYKRLFLADVDGTGTSDVIYIGEDRVILWRNIVGKKFAKKVVIKGLPGSSIESIRMIDLFGQGRVGVLWSNIRNSRRFCYRFLSFSDKKPYLLTTIREGIGLETRIEYGSSCNHALRDAKENNPWNTQLPIPIPVINRISQVDLVTGIKDTYEILYHDGCWDSSSRRFRGFGRVTIKHIGRTDDEDIYEEHKYLVGNTNEPSICDLGGVKYRIFNQARRGQVYNSIYYSKGNDSTPIRIEKTHWWIQVIDNGIDGSPVLFPKVTKTETYNIEGGNHPRVVIAEYDYDKFGNVTKERRKGTAPMGDDNGNSIKPLEVITEVEYAYNNRKHIVDRIARIVRRNINGEVLAELRHYYDGVEFQGLMLGKVDKGLISRQEEIVITKSRADTIYGENVINWKSLGYHETKRIDGEIALAVNRTRIAHNSKGMPTRRLDGLGEQIKFDYDTDELLVNRVENGIGHVYTASYDSSWQLIEKRTEPDGSTMLYTYDGLGRVCTIIRPSDSPSFPTVRYLHNHNSLPISVHIKKRRKSKTDKIYEKTIYFDGFGREIQSRTLVDEQKIRVSGVMSYNQKGDPIFKGLPLFRSSLLYETSDVLPITSGYHYIYDGLGRIIVALNPQKKKFRVSYTPWSAIFEDVIDTDPTSPHANTPRIQHFDAFGRLIGVSLFKGIEKQHRAEYTYDLLGRLTSSTDLEGRSSIKSIIYDGRGARLRIDHAIAGPRTMLYDASGRLVKFWDDRKMQIERDFDKIGRLTKESINGVVQEIYHWDEHPNQIGRLSFVEDKAGKVYFTYDKCGRVSAKIREINDKSYRIQYSYDPTGLLEKLVYPDDTEVNFNRLGDGRIKKINNFVEKIEYNELGQPKEISHKNGIKESLEFDNVGYLSQMKFSSENKVLYNSKLTHDAAGHLVSFNQNAGPEPYIEKYEIDSLNRLSNFQLSKTNSITQWNYEYDADGNLQKANEMGIKHYEYDFNTPGALKKIVHTDQSIENIEFDVAGNLTTMKSKKLKFDAHGRLTKIIKDDGTIIEMIYDYRGARVAKKVTGPNGNYETRYIDNIYEEKGGIGTAYIIAAGRIVGHTRGGGRRHIHTDHRGSVILITKSNGKVDDRGWFGPYGLGKTVAEQEISHQYTGAVYDPETKFYYLNHRFYCPSLGRFLSPDPILLAKPESELAIPEIHNLYAYAKGDPIDYIDPNGLGFWSTFGKVLAGIVAAVFIVAAIVMVVAVVAAALVGGGWAIVLGFSAFGALIGGIQGGWEGALLGTLIGFTAGINFMFFAPLGIVTFLGIFEGVRERGWYKSLAGWSSWFMPASWPGHIMGLGVFLANGIATVFGSEKQIESVKFDWKHGQILTAGGEYGGRMFPGMNESIAYNLGGFSFFSNDFWDSSGGTWAGVQRSVEHETGHMLSNAVFGFWQGIINGIENLTTNDHEDRLFEKIAESNVNEADRRDSGDEIPFWH